MKIRTGIYVLKYGFDLNQIKLFSNKILLRKWCNDNGYIEDTKIKDMLFFNKGENDGAYAKLYEIDEM